MSSIYVTLRFSEILNQDQDDTFRISSSGSNSLFCNCLHHLFEEITGPGCKDLVIDVGIDLDQLNSRI